MVEGSEQPAITPKRAILVVDDDDDVRKCISRLLQRANHTVHTATDGVEALDRCRELGTVLALVLLDLAMPRMDGVATLKALRDQGTTVPVLICSSAVSLKQRTELDQLGVAGYLNKPFPLAELLAAVTRVLSAPPLPQSSS